MGDDTTGSLAAALAAFQAELPSIRKGETATVETKGGGSYSYTYADLADIAAAVHPRLADYGLSFVACPTLDDQGRFGLAYALLHTSGQERAGFYPLPSNGTPQQVGSAITYARRYVLCAVTGVAPEDDDGRAAEAAARASVPANPLPGKRIQDALAEAGVPAKAFTNYLGSQGFEKWSEVPAEDREAMADGIVNGSLLDDVKLCEVPS